MSELIVKNDDGFRVATRHYVHALNDQLEKADKEIAAAREEASEHVSLERLEVAYPVDMFSRYSGDLNVIDEVAERVTTEGTSYRVMALEVQEQITRAFIQIEQRVAEHKGTAKLVDDRIDAVMGNLFVMTSASTFVEKSVERRNERVQELLNSPSPSRFAQIVGVDFTQRQAVENVLRPLSDLLDEYANSGGVEEVRWHDEVDRRVEDELWESLFEEAKERIERGFVDNEARKQVLEVVMPEVEATLMEKVSGKVWDAMVEQEPVVAAV